MIKQIKVGDTLYREKGGGNIPLKMVEYKVEKIGIKYLYLEDLDRYPINKDTLKYENKEYSHSNFQLYRTAQEILALRERRYFIAGIGEFFRMYNWSNNLTMEQLIKINDIIHP